MFDLNSSIMYDMFCVETVFNRVTKSEKKSKFFDLKIVSLL